MHPHVHPTPLASTDAAGVTFGIDALARPNSTTFEVPIVDGFLRLGREGGQATIRVGYGDGRFSYRFELVEAASFRLSIEPSLGTWFWTNVGPASGAAFAISPGVSLLFMGAGAPYYFSPRIEQAIVYESDEEHLDRFTSVGAAVGYVFRRERLQVSMEFAIVRDRAFDRPVGPWIFATSVGIQLTRPSPPPL